MQEFFSAQKDFILFIHGISFFLLAGSSYLSYRIKPAHYFWKWIAVAGISQALVQWIGVVLLLYPADPGMLAFMRAFFAGCAWLCLLEIIRNAFPQKYKRIAGVLIYFVLLPLCIGMRIDPFFAAGSWGWIALGTAIGLAAAWCIERINRKDLHPERYLTMFALLLAADVSMFCLAMPGIVGVFIVTISALLVWKYYLKQRMKIVAGRDKSYGLRMGVIFPFSLLILVLAGWLCVEMIGQKRIDEKKRILQALVEHETDALVSGRIDELHGTPEDIQTDFYKHLSKEVMGVFVRYPEAESVYIFGQRDKEHIFLFDSENPLKPGNDVPLAEPGKIYPQDRELLQRMFRDGGVVIVGPEEDEWGVFMSGLAAIRSPLTSRVAAVLGVDYAAEEWARDVLQYRFIAIAVFFVFIVLFIIFFIIYKHEKEIQQDLKAREQKLLELSALLDRQRTSLETIFNSTQVGLILVDAKRQIKRINGVIADIIGKDARAMLGHAPGEGLNCIHLTGDDLVCGEAPACALCPLARTVKDVLSRGDTVRGMEIQHRFYRSSGEEGLLWLEVNASPLVLQEQRHVLLSIENVTDRRRAEKELEKYRLHLEELVHARTEELALMNERLRTEIVEREAANRKLKDANELKTRFLFNVSHEIRTPLNGIIGFAELITHSRDITRSATMARTILQEADILLALVNDVLDQAMIETGRIAIESSVVDIQDVLSPVMKTMTMFASKKGVEFRLEGVEHIPRFFMTDRLRLSQILLNLMNNAFKFTEEGSVVLRMEVAGRDKDKIVVRFSVIDTGVGIPKERQHLIFERFVQVDGTSTRKHGGAGLGTSIAKGLVECMGGRISFTSQEGVGSTFWFELPLQECHDPVKLEKPADGDPETDVLPKMSGPILAVEDYDVNQDVIRMNFERAGYQGDIVSDGFEALKACGMKEYKLILMDIQMPGMDGFEATQKIRALGSWAGKVPIIGVTANVDEYTRRRCLEVGMQDVMAKPFRYQKFMAMLAHWLGAEGVLAVTDGERQTDVTPVLDYDEAIKEFAGNKTLFDGVMDRFLLQVKQQLKTLALALESKDAASIGREAHKIKGAAANLTAMRVSGCAKLMEEKGKSNDLQGLDALLEDLTGQIVVLEAYFREQKDKLT